MYATYSRIIVILALLATVLLVTVLVDTPETLAAVVTPIVTMIGLAIAFIFAKNGVEASHKIEASIGVMQEKIEANVIKSDADRIATQHAAEKVEKLTE